MLKRYAKLISRKYWVPRKAQEQEASRKALERELSIATKIQTGLLPDDVPEIAGYQLFPYYESAKEVGGDYYDIVEIAPHRYAIVVADVSGTITQ